MQSNKAKQDAEARQPSTPDDEPRTVAEQVAKCDAGVADIDEYSADSEDPIMAASFCALIVAVNAAMKLVKWAKTGIPVPLTREVTKAFLELDIFLEVVPGLKSGELHAAPQIGWAKTEKAWTPAAYEVACDFADQVCRIGRQAAALHFKGCRSRHALPGQSSLESDTALAGWAKDLVGRLQAYAPPRYEGSHALRAGLVSMHGILMTRLQFELKYHMRHSATPQPSGVQELSPLERKIVMYLGEHECYGQKEIWSYRLANDASVTKQWRRLTLDEMHFANATSDSGALKAAAARLVACRLCGNDFHSHRRIPGYYLTTAGRLAYQRLQS
jgi:hypothetical protein